MKSHHDNQKDSLVETAGCHIAFVFMELLKRNADSPTPGILQNVWVDSQNIFPVACIQLHSINNDYYATMHRYFYWYRLVNIAVSYSFTRVLDHFLVFSMKTHKASATRKRCQIPCYQNDIGWYSSHLCGSSSSHQRLWLWRLKQWHPPSVFRHAPM